MPLSTNLVRKHWQTTASQALPPPQQILARNAAITACYARWYSQPQHLFKWAGAAAFSSHRVGLLLAAYQYTVDDGPITTAAKLVSNISNIIHSHAHDSPEGLVADLELIRRTNNLVFDDIGWAHVAYADPHGGLAAVEAGLEGELNCERLLQGFREIEAGRLLFDAGPSRRAEAEAHVWNGNRLLLQHEQFVIVQSQFDTMAAGMNLFLSLMTWMDFELEGFRFLSWKDWLNDAHHLLWMGEHLLEHHRTFTSFFVYMATPPGLALLAAAHDGPDIAHIEQRWAWADNEVLRIWRYVDGNDPQLPAKMERIVQGPLIGTTL